MNSINLPTNEISPTITSQISNPATEGLTTGGSNRQNTSTPVGTINQTPQALSNLQSNGANTNGSALRVLFDQPLIPLPPATTLVPSINDDGKLQIETRDGYRIEFAGTEQKWTITSAEGKVTTIWGDPHVIESDGDKWDFLDDITIQIGENKITVQTVPAWNGETFTGTVSIYNGSDRVTVTDIDKDKPTLEAWSFDAKQHDITLADGTSYRISYENSTREEWTKILADEDEAEKE